METIQEISLHFYYRLKRTVVLFAGYYKGKWIKSISETLFFGLCSAIAGPLVTRQNFDIATLILSGVAGIGIWLVMLLLVSFIRAPSSLYFEQQKEADKYNWNNVDICPKITKDGSRFKRYGIIIKNKKKYNLDGNVNISYLEIDDKVIVDHRRDQVTLHNFPVFNQGTYDGNNFFPVEKKGTEITFLDCQSEKNQDIHRIIYCDQVEFGKYNFDLKIVPFERRARCDLYITGRIVNHPNPPLEGVTYSFDISLVNNKPVILFTKGSLQNYRY